jgi:hypothetical protein
LADCWERVGRTASAWGMFLDVAAAARAANQNDRVKVAKARAAQLEPKLAHLILHVASVETGLEVRRDGQLVGQASYDVPVPVDPGPHRIEVTAPGKKPFSTTADVALSASLTVQLAKLENAEGAAAAPVPENPAAGVSNSGSSTTPAPSATPSPHSRVLPYTLGGIGIVALAAGGVFEIMSRGANSDALGICPGDAPCTQPDIDKHAGLLSDAKRDQLIAIVGAGVGAASLLTAVVLLTTQPSTTAAQNRRGLSLDFAANPLGGSVLAKGRF